MTEILADGRMSDAERANELLPLVYEQLRQVARHVLAGERPGHTLQPTALVHEAYLRLIGDREVPWTGRAHFYAAAAESMRRILLDHARQRGRIKRGGDRRRLLVDDIASLAELSSRDSSEIVRFDQCFQRFENEHLEAATIVRLRFFAGLSHEHTAKAMGVSKATVERRWSFARAWLYRTLKGE